MFRDKEGATLLLFLIINYFSMRNKENKFVTTTSMVAVTPAQAKLLDVLRPIDAALYADSLRHIHDSGTYDVDIDMLDQRSAYLVHELLDLVRAIEVEYDLHQAATS